MAASLSAMALRRFAPKILRSSSALPLTSPFSTSPSSLISSSSPSLAPVVQKPAPAFKAQAVVDGQFKEVHTVLLIFSHLRYILQCLRFNLHFTCTGVSLWLCWKVCGGLLLPPGLHFCLPDWDYCILWQDSRVQRHRMWGSLDLIMSNKMKMFWRLSESPRTLTSLTLLGCLNLASKEA